jgi:hypothetical protein
MVDCELISALSLWIACQVPPYWESRLKRSLERPDINIALTEILLNSTENILTIMS